MYLKIITVNNTTNNSIQVTYLVQRTLKLRFRPRVLIQTSFLSFQDNLAIDLLGKNELPWTQISQYWCYCKMKRVAKQFMNFTWLVLYITLGELGREYRGQRNGKNIRFKVSCWAWPKRPSGQRIYLTVSKSYTKEK